MTNQEELSDFNALKLILENELIADKKDINNKLLTTERKKINLCISNSDSEPEDNKTIKACNKYDLLNSKINKHNLLYANFAERYND